MVYGSRGYRYYGLISGVSDGNHKTLLFTIYDQVSINYGIYVEIYGQNLSVNYELETWAKKVLWNRSQ